MYGTNWRCHVCKYPLPPTVQQLVCDETGRPRRDHYLEFTVWTEQNTAMKEIFIAWRDAALVVHVTVTSMAGHEFSELDVKRGTTIRKLKKHIAEGRGNPNHWRLYRLLCGTQLLEDYAFLWRKCGVNRSVTLNLIVDGGGSERDSDTDGSSHSWYPLSRSLFPSGMVFFPVVSLPPVVLPWGGYDRWMYTNGTSFIITEDEFHGACAHNGRRFREAVCIVVSAGSEFDGSVYEEVD